MDQRSPLDLGAPAAPAPAPAPAVPSAEELAERLARLEQAHLELVDAHAALRAEHQALRPASAVDRSAGPNPADVHDLVEPGPGGPAATSRRMLIGGGLAGAAAVVAGALLGAEPAAATTGAMQFGANNNAGTSGTNLTSSAVDKTLFIENTGAAGQGLRVTANGTAFAPTSTGSIGIDASGKTTGVIGESVTGVGLRGASTSGTAGTFFSSTGKGVSISSNLAQLELRPVSADRGAPSTDVVAHQPGDLVRDAAGDLWLCTKSGVPGTWRKLAGPATAGALHVLAKPVRIYDSRPGTTPAIGPKTKFAANEVRTLDCTVNATGVPADAVAVQLTCLIVNAAAGAANFTVWAAGPSKPTSNSLVWGGDTGRASTLAISALGTGAKVQVCSSIATDLVVDVVGYYR